jgi:hypothetical protein
MTISHWLLPRMRNVLDKSCRENRNTHFMFSNFFRKSCRLWDNVEKYDGARGVTNYVTIWFIQVAYWISKATCTQAHAHAHAPEAHAGTRANTQISNMYSFSTATIIANAPQCYVIRTLAVLLCTDALHSFECTVSRAIPSNKHVERCLNKKLCVIASLWNNGSVSDCPFAQQ